MDFTHTDDRRMLADTLNRYIGKQYGFSVRDKNARSTRGYSAEFWMQYAELGAIGALFHEVDGGYGGAGFDILVVFEAVGRGLVTEPFLGALMAGTAVARGGSRTMKSALLPPLMEGRSTAAFAHTEPASHHEYALVRTRATRDGDGWRLDGTKTVIDGGEHADWFVVTARSSCEEHDMDGISIFVVPADTPGLRSRGYPLIDGGRAADVEFNAVRVGPDALVGKADEGYPVLEYAIGRGVLALCAEALGALDVARDATLEYLQTRRQFGVPIGHFQALQHRMADLLLEIEQARSAVINAAAMLDHPARAARERALSAAKYTIGRVGTMAAEEFIQLHGGIGMTWELPLAHYAKRLVMIDHQLGDADHHLERYIAAQQNDKETNHAHIDCS